MKCSKHQAEKITCINIDPDATDKRLLCIDCYIEAMQSQVPKEHIIRIRDILRNPNLLFSLPEQWYSLFHVIQNKLNRRIDINKKLFELKERIQNSVNDLFRWFDQYSKDIEMLWEQTVQVEKNIWNQISFDKNEQFLKNIISDEDLQDEDGLVTQSLNNMFAQLEIDNNLKLEEEIEGITRKYGKITNQTILDALKQNEETFEQASQIFIQTHNKIFNTEFKIPSQYNFIDKNYKMHLNLFKQQFDSSIHPQLTEIYDAITKDIKQNFELQLIQTYTDFANIDLTLKMDQSQLIVISDTNAKISVGYYLPINYKQNSLLFDFDKPLIWKQTKNINTLVKKKINYASNQFEYQIGQKFISIDCDGQTAFQNKSNEYFTKIIPQILPPKPEIKQDTQVSRNPQNSNSLRTANDLSNQHIQPPSQSLGLLSTFGQSFPPQNLQQSGFGSFTQAIQLPQQPSLGMAHNPFQLGQLRGFSNSPQTIQTIQTPIGSRSLNSQSSLSQNQGQQLGIFNNGLQSNNTGTQQTIATLPIPSTSIQSQPIQTIQNQQVNQPIADIFAQINIISSNEVKFKANQIRIFKVIPTYN